MSNQTQTPVVDTTNVLDDKLALVTVTIKCFSGYRRSTREIIAQLGGNLPDSAAVTEGSIKVFPNDRLNPFATLRRAVFRKVAAKGVKALGSGNTFAIPREALPDIEAILDDASNEFATELNTLEANYDDWFDEHVQNNPEAGSIIRAMGIPKQAALARFGYDSHIFKIVPIAKPGEEEKNVSTIVQGLARQLFEEVSAEAEKLLEKSDAFTKYQKAGQKTLRPVKDALSKMKGLEFLDSSVTGGIQLIEEVLSVLPQTGYIEDSGLEKPFSTLRRMLEVMSDVEEFFDSASRIRNGVPVVEVLFPPKVVPVEAVPDVQEEVPDVQEIALPELSTLDLGDMQGFEDDFDLPALDDQQFMRVPASAPAQIELLMF